MSGDVERSLGPLFIVVLKSKIQTQYMYVANIHTVYD